MKKLTLEQTWTMCLRMWRWIAKEWKSNNRLTVYSLKRQWLKANGFEVGLGATDNCFFCAHTLRVDCCDCPGVLVNSFFDCESAEYNYFIDPPAFYKELLRLNRIRKANKKKGTKNETQEKTTSSA